MTKYQAMGLKRNFGRKPVRIMKNGKVVGEYPSLLSAANALNISYTRASMCANGKIKMGGECDICFL